MILPFEKNIEAKICKNMDDLRAKLQDWAKTGKRVVFTNGCFDLLHRGHVDYLAKAADLGEKLIVGVNSDASVSRIKGSSRPIQDEQSRLTILAALECVAAVILFDEDTPYELIKAVQPHVLVKGSDYKPQEIVGYDIIIANKGEVKTIDYLPGYSTSAIEKKIRTN